MHYTVDYTKLEGQAKIDKALQDIRDYMGRIKMLEIERSVKSELSRLTRLGFIAQLDMFAGISGYPAEAWADHIGFPAYTEAELKIIAEQQAEYKAMGEAEACGGLADRD